MTLEQATKRAAAQGGGYVYFSRMFTDWVITRDKRATPSRDTDAPLFTVLADGRVLAPGKLEQR